MASSFSISDAISVGWDTTKKNLSFFVLLTIIVGIVSTILSRIQEYNQDNTNPISLVAQIVLWIVSIFLEMGIIKISLNAVDGKKLDYGDLIGNSNQFIAFLLTSLAYGVIVICGMFLLIVPGIIWAITFQFYSYFIVDQNQNLTGALKMSDRITKGEKWQLLLFGLALIGVNILGALALVIGLLVTVPLTMIATAYVFRKLEAAHPAVEAMQASQLVQPPQAAQS